MPNFPSTASNLSMPVAPIHGKSMCCIYYVCMCMCESVYTYIIVKVNLIHMSTHAAAKLCMCVLHGNVESRGERRTV